MSTPSSIAPTPSLTSVVSSPSLSASLQTSTVLTGSTPLSRTLQLSSTSLSVETTPTSATSASSSAETTSTPQTTTSPVQATTTQTSQGSTPSASSTPSSTPSSTFSSAHPLLSTAPPPSSSSQQVTQTTVTSAYTTYVNGSTVPTYTSFPSTIPELSTPSSSHRTAIIAGSAAGGTALLILLLSLAFCARRKQFKRLDFIQAISLKRKQERSRATLLDGEDLDDDHLARPPQRYSDYDTPWDASLRTMISRKRTPAPAPSRWSESGSAFKEDLWPPPNRNTDANAHEGTRLIDPVVYMDYPELDLSRIVDDVMGPSSSGTHFSDRSVASIYRGSVVESEGVVHSRTVSDASNIALLEAAGLGAPVTTTVAVSSPLAQPGTRPGGSSEHGAGEAS